MSQATVQALVNLLSNGQYDSTLFPVLYADVINELGDRNWLTSAVPVAFTENSANVNLPAQLLNILCLIYDNTVLSDLSLRELEAIKYGWRNVKGSPIAFTREALTTKSVQIFPVPTQTSPLIVPVHGLPTGEDYQPGNGLVIQSENRTDALPYLDIPIALKYLYREYMRESDHQDMSFAMLCGKLGDFLFGALAG